MVHARRWLVPALFLATAVACGRPAREYPLRGQVITVGTSGDEVTVKHEDIPGFMAAMTMAYKVRDRQDLRGLAPGDLITAMLVVTANEAHLSKIVRTGRAPIAAGTPTPRVMDLLQPGDAVPDGALMDETGTPRKLSDWRGKALGVTFIYTRCPMPDFCPRIDRGFAAVQRAVQADGALRDGVHLISVSFDPDHDSAEVLKAHATGLGADPRLWTFATAPRDDLDRFASRFGVSIIREADAAATITHNLRTAVIDPAGRVVKIYSDSDWTPEALVEDLRGARAR